MKEFFEYFFYRMYRRDNNKENATLFVTITQVMFVMNLILLTIYGPLEIRGKITIIEKIIVIVLGLTLAFFNLNFYSKKLEELEKKWGNESTKEKRIGMVKIVLFAIVSWGFIFINGWIYNRYK